MTDGPTDLDRLVDETEQMGVVGSPSSTAQLAVDILGSAAGRKLVGELAFFRFLQGASPHYALGQITEIELQNAWHEDPAMRSLIRARGRVDAVSGRQDTHLGRMTVSAVFRGTGPGAYEPSILGTVPPTGTSIRLATDGLLDEMLRPYRSQLFYLGRVYGSEPRLPLWFKHFGAGADGVGEAYHLGIFGKTGSGKSVLAKMIMLAYASYPGMSLLVIDPQGEFARDMRPGGPKGGFGLPLGDVARRLGKQAVVLTVGNLVLDRWDLFRRILSESPFFERLTVPPGENRELACGILASRLQRASVELPGLHLRTTFDRAWQLLADERVQRVFYRTDATRARFNDALAGADPDEFYNDHWSPVARLFRLDRPNTRTVDTAIEWLLKLDREVRPLLVIDLSGERDGEVFWNERIQSLVIRRLLDELSRRAEQSYAEGESLNTLVVIDEAHRVAPSVLPKDDATGAEVRSVLIDAARTTRKHGLGWLFISQTLSSIHPEILQQLRVLFFGFGLGLGQEFQALGQLVGASGSGKELDLYRLFRDPQSAFDAGSRQYSFMTIGPVSPLSFAGSPLFLNAFNTARAFLEANGLDPASGADDAPAP